jgi:hypothetical protein
MSASPSALVLSEAEAEEVRILLPQVDAPRRADQHMARARLRRLRYPTAASPTVADFEALLDSGEIQVDQTGLARITRQTPGRVFKVSIGVSGHPVPPTWCAFDQRYQWLGAQPSKVSSGDHLFALAVDMWGTGGSAVVGLYEAVSPGAQALPGSPDVTRWPLALGVRPLAAILPPQAEHIPGVYGPQNPIPVRVGNPDHQTALYTAVKDSPPPPPPSDVAGKVQEIEWRDVGDDVVRAVFELGNQAKTNAVLERAIEIGGWTEEEREALAWYTSANAENSHVRLVVRQAIDFEQTFTGRIHRDYATSPFYVVGDYQPPDIGFGAKYRPASNENPTEPDGAPHSFNLDALERATARHMKLQDDLAAALVARGIEPRSPTASQPMFDLAFEHEGTRHVVEAKSGDPASAQQVRYGVGQVLEYAHMMAAAGGAVIPVILIESAPPAPWVELAGSLGVRMLIAADLDASLDVLVQSP